MGILTELFVATDEEGRSYDSESAGRFQSVELGGLTSLEFETLWAILEAKEWGPDSHALHEVRPSGDTWTFKFPAAYVERLRKLDSAGIAAAAERWAATEELACAPAEVEPVIVALVSIARSFHDGDRSLFLWGSL
jgi:hypothetical protein